LHTIKESAWIKAWILTLDERSVVSASDDGTVKVWDLDTGALRHTFNRHAGRVSAVTMTPDRKRLITVSEDGTLKVWELETGILLRTLKGEGSTLRYFALTIDGSRHQFASDSSDPYGNAVISVAVTPDGRCAVSASTNSNALKVWDLATGETKFTLIGHAGAITAVAVTPDGRYAISASKDRTLKIWDLESGTISRTFECFGEPLSLLVTPDGRRLITTLWNGLQVWDREGGARDSDMYSHKAPVTALEVALDGQCAISASLEGTVKVWNLEIGMEVSTWHPRSGISAIAVSLDGKRIVVASEKEIEVLNLKTGERLIALGPIIGAVAVTEHGQIVYSSGAALNVWDPVSGAGRVIFGSGHHEEISHMALTSAGKVIFLCKGTIRVLDLASGTMQFSMELGPRSAVTGLKVTPDGRYAVSASFDGILVWDLHEGIQLHHLDSRVRDSRDARTLAITPDGRHVIYGAVSNSFQVWDLQDGAAKKRLWDSGGRVSAVATMANGLWVAATAGDILRIWDLKSGILISRFNAEGSLERCAAAPDGKTVIMSDGQGRMYILRVEGRS
jgi:WD40 repeat protein